MKNYRKLTLVATAFLGLANAETATAFSLDDLFTQIRRGPGVDVGKCVGATWVDYDNDGFLDLFAGNRGDNPGDGNFLYRNNGNGTFTRITEGSVVTDRVRTVGGAWGDYDNDGFMDLFVGNYRDEQDFLYQNNGNGTFTKITGGPLLTDFGSAGIGAWADYDRDGFLDLFVPRISGSGRLYHNNGNGNFPDFKTFDANSTEPGAAAWADFDNDGDPDLLVTALGSGKNTIFRNDGLSATKTVFTKFNDGVISSEGGNSVSCAWGDYDNDGFLDLFIPNGTGHQASLQYTNFLYHNMGNGSFAKVSGSPVSDDRGDSYAASWADVDNDGDLDLFVANGSDQMSFFYLNNGDGTFTKVQEGAPLRPGKVSCIAWGDYDNDGFLDLFLTQYDYRGNLLFRNRTNGNHWLKLKLIGTVSNRSALGAKVRVKATIGGTTYWQMREINMNDGWSDVHLLAHFGLGQATNVETLRIEWPSGQVQELANVPANQMLTLQEPPRLEPTVKALNGVVDLKVRGWKGFTYEIEGSSDLLSWQRLGTAQNLTGALQATDPEAGERQRFYRLVVP
ncbi:MAG: CRTAC1 family protein [Verrucomicrobia bacterium]|nr:CRTAC1 family protein [Verrucomicrobiota bacterium]